MSLDSSDLKTIGVILLTATLYQIIGLAFSLITKATTPNPKYWFGGLLMAGIFTNSGDLPLAYIATLSSGTLFTVEDSNKGIAYSVLFLTIFIFSMFNLGGFRLIENDFKRKVSDIENGSYDPEIAPEPGLYALISDIKRWYNRKQKKAAENTSAELDSRLQSSQSTKRRSLDNSSTKTPKSSPDDLTVMTYYSGSSNERPLSRLKPLSSVVQLTVPGLGTLDEQSDSDRESISFPQQSETITDVINAYAHPTKLRRTISSASHPQNQDEEEFTVDLTRVSSLASRVQSLAASRRQYKKQFHEFIQKYHLTLPWEFVKNFARPPSAALIIAIVITMIPPLRALFFNAHKSGVHIPDAPDGGPILGFIMDFTSFVGNAAVPLGLSMLGATMARLSIGKLPKGFWKSIVIMGLFKLVLLPIIAVAWTQKLKSIGWIAKDNYMVMLVMIVSSGVPSSTSQVYLTAIYTPPNADRKEMDCLAAYLIFQYALLIFSMTILLTYTLKNVLEL